MTLKSTLMDSAAVGRALRRISFEVIEKNRGANDLCIVGIRRRGVCIARELQKNIAATEGITVPVGELDITFYRDDLSEKQKEPTLNNTDIPFDITDKTVILTDDVIFTGRTVRAAIDALFSLGRPRAIRFAALVDRGHRELPIKADYVGKNVPTSLNEVIKVTFPDYDNVEPSVLLFSKNN